MHHMKTEMCSHVCRVLLSVQQHQRETVAGKTTSGKQPAVQNPVFATLLGVFVSCCITLFFDSVDVKFLVFRLFKREQIKFLCLPLKAAAFLK